MEVGRDAATEDHLIRDATARGRLRVTVSGVGVALLMTPVFAAVLFLMTTGGRTDAFRDAPLHLHWITGALVVGVVLLTVAAVLLPRLQRLPAALPALVAAPPVAIAALVATVSRSWAVAAVGGNIGPATNARILAEGAAEVLWAGLLAGPFATALITSVAWLLVLRAIYRGRALQVRAPFFAVVGAGGGAFVLLIAATFGVRGLWWGFPAVHLVALLPVIVLALGACAEPADDVPAAAPLDALVAGGLALLGCVLIAQAAHVSGMVRAFSALGGESVDPAMKAAIMTEGRSEAREVLLGGLLALIPGAVAWLAAALWRGRALLTAPARVVGALASVALAAVLTLVPLAAHGLVASAAIDDLFNVWAPDSPRDDQGHLRPVVVAPVATLRAGQVLVDGRSTGSTRSLPAGSLRRLQELHDAFPGKRRLWQQLHPGEPFPGVVNLYCRDDERIVALRAAAGTLARAGFPHVYLEHGTGWSVLEVVTPDRIKPVKAPPRELHVRLKADRSVRLTVQEGDATELSQQALLREPERVQAAVVALFRKGGVSDAKQPELVLRVEDKPLTCGDVKGVLRAIAAAADTVSGRRGGSAAPPGGSMRDKAPWTLSWSDHGDSLTTRRADPEQVAPADASSPQKGEQFGLLGLTGGAPSTGVASPFVRVPSHVTVKLTIEQLAGRLPKHVVARILSQQRGQAARCYATQLEQEPELKGEAELSFAVSPEGTALGLSVGGSLSNKQVLTCIAKAYRSLSFPKPEGGVVRVVAKLAFAPKAARRP